MRNQAEETATPDTIDQTTPETDAAGTPSPAGQEPADTDEHNAEHADDEDDAIADEVTVTIEGATPAPNDPDEPSPDQLRAAEPWVRATRKKNRELQKRLRALEAQVARSAQAAAPPAEPAAPQLGPRPKIEDFEWDENKFEEAVIAWAEKKRAVEEHAAKQRQAAEAERDAWGKKLQSFQRAEAELRVRNYPEAKAAVIGALDITQQGIIVDGCKNPALVVHALGSNPEVLKTLANIKSPVQFAMELARIESRMQTTPARKPPPPTPETVPRGISGRRNGDDAELERLRQGVVDGSVPASKLFEYKRAMAARASKPTK